MTERIVGPDLAAWARARGIDIRALTEREMRALEWEFELEEWDHEELEQIMATAPSGASR